MSLSPPRRFRPHCGPLPCLSPPCGCSSGDGEPNGIPCGPNGECPSGYRCDAKSDRCEISIDVAAPDALSGTPDALSGTPDALSGPPDALPGPPDALSGPPD